MAKAQDKTTSGRRRSAAGATTVTTPKSGRAEGIQKWAVKSGKELVGSVVEVVDVRPGGRLVVRETKHQGQKVKVYRLKGGAIRKSSRRVVMIAETPEAAKLSLQHINQEANEIVARVVDWAGGEDEAWKWYRAHPIPAFGDRTAESLVKTGNAEQVREYLDAVATGAFS
ncbi:MAG: MbcA/ParS/Xre antitoxin family protein [Verrucomicrobiota bacterium]